MITVICLLIRLVIDVKTIKHSIQTIVTNKTKSNIYNQIIVQLSNYTFQLDCRTFISTILYAYFSYIDINK